MSRHLTAAESIPAQPALTRFPAELADRVDEAERRAGSLWHPPDGPAVLGRLYHANGFYNEALQCYTASAGSSLRELAGQIWKPRFSPSSGIWMKPMEPLHRTIVLAPRYVPARLALAHVLLNANQTAQVAAVYTDALALDSDNPYAWLGLARCAIAEGDWSKAREQLQQALQARPEFVGALSLMVTVCEHFEQPAEAARYRAAMSGREFPDYYADEWRDGITDDCSDACRLSVSAAVALAAGDTKLAKLRLERGVEIAPSIASDHRQLAMLLSRQGNLPVVREHLQKAVAAMPSDANSWLQLVQNFSATGEMPMAERTLAAGLAARPQSPSLHLERARWLPAAGRTEEAIAEFRESYRLRPPALLRPGPRRRRGRRVERGAEQAT